MRSILPGAADAVRAALQQDSQPLKASFESVANRQQVIDLAKERGLEIIDADSDTQFADLNFDGRIVTGQKMSTDFMKCGERGLAAALNEREPPRLIILDLMLPGMSGIELCRRLRSRSETLPIIFVTSREEEFDRVLGLEIGADDYLCKPFSMRELLARVKVLFRRAAIDQTAAVSRAATEIVRHDDLELDLQRYSVKWKGIPLNLTVTCETSFTVSRTQTLYAWNWSTSAWDQVNSATVGTTDVTKTWTPASVANYVGPSREVRFRVKGNNRNSTYTSRGDFMSFEYDYAQGTGPMAAAGRSRDAAEPASAGIQFAAFEGDDHEADGHVHAEHALREERAHVGVLGEIASGRVGRRADVDQLHPIRGVRDPLGPLEVAVEQDRRGDAKHATC